MDCLSEDEMSALVAGTLDASRRADATAHVMACSRCARVKEEIAALVLSGTLAPARTLAGGPPAHETLPGGPAGPSTNPDSPQARHRAVPSHARGSNIGRYVVLNELGRGGMGEVFAAYDPKLDRKVALKLLRAGALSQDEAQTRLLREAQAMARLSHPNVATVHDSELLGDRVFIAMEFIDGESLSQWLRQGHGWEETLALFLAAGEGLAAAHRAGIIHRDFKPDNVLIGKDGRPRVLDFGLAREAGQALEVRTTDSLPDVPLEKVLGVQLTRDGAVMGTPGYMAPEQLGGRPTDARSDQFSFCVALWEALYGGRPYGGDTLRAHAAQMAEGKLPDPPPGTKVPDWVRAALQRGLAFDPSRRWETMDALLAALRPRRKGSRGRQVLGVALVLGAAALALGVGLYREREKVKVCGGTTGRLAGVWDDASASGVERAFLATRAPFARASFTGTKAALDAYAQSWVKAADDTCMRGRVTRTDPEEVFAQKSLCVERRLRQFRALVRLFESADRGVVANAVNAARALEPVAACQDTVALAARARPREQSAAAAADALSASLADVRVLHDTGKFAEGVKAAQAAVERGGPADVLAEAWLLLGRLQLRQGDRKQGEVALFEAATLAEAADVPDVAARAFARLAGALDYATARHAEAHRWLRLATAAAERVGSPPELAADIATNAGYLAVAESELSRAQEQFEKALALLRQFRGDDHPEVAQAWNNLGVVLARYSKNNEAIAAYEKSLELQEKNLGPDHPDTAKSRQNLAVVLNVSGRVEDALRQSQRAYEIRLRTLGEAHPETLASKRTVGKIYGRLGDYGRGLSTLREVLEAKRKLADDRVDEAEILDDIAHLHRDAKNHKEALVAAQQALALEEQELGADNVRTCGTRELVGLLHAKLGQWSAADAQLKRALELRKAKLGPEHPLVASSLNAQGDLEMDLHRFQKARDLYLAALAVREKALGPDHPDIARDLVGLGGALRGLKENPEAVAALERAVILRERQAIPRDLASARFLLGQALWDLGPEHRVRAHQLVRSAADLMQNEPAAVQQELADWLGANPAPSN